MKINPEMVVLARELRGLTQVRLAREMSVSQAKISKLEGGIKTEVDELFLDLLCSVLRMPSAFFLQEDELLGVGSSAYYYRKKAELTASDRDRIHAVVNLMRIHIKRLLSSIDIQPKRGLPRLDVEDYGGSAANVAQAVRSFWFLTNGPIKNITSLIESAGVIVVNCDFGTRSMDATSLRLADCPPLIFINRSLPADRWRFTLAHELGHLVMHDVPHEQIENEADQFAAEFLMPELEIRAQFERMQPIRLEDIANLKPFWRTSMNALLKRAGELGFLSAVQKSRLWARMAQLGWRTREPNPLPPELPTTIGKIASYFVDELRFTATDVATLLKVTLDDLRALYDVLFFPEDDQARKPQLRIV